MKPIKAAIISVSGYELNDDEKYLIERENPLGISLFSRNIQTPQQLAALTASIKETAGRQDILIATDQEGGRVCRLAPPHFRTYISQAAVGSLPFAEAQTVAGLHAELIADDLRRTGINCNFAPVLDVLTNNITQALKSRCFSDNSQNVAQLGKIMLNTYHAAGILACIKHIPGHGGAENDPHLQLSVIHQLNQQHLYPFEYISQDALMAMTAHIVLSEIDSLPITMSKKAIDTLIRGKLGFQGLLISDALEMKALTGTLTEKTISARTAGCDAVCYCRGDMDGLRAVLDNCGFLSDDTLAVNEKISGLISKPYMSQNMTDKARQYELLSQNAVAVPDDYDAVEVLMKLNSDR